MTLLAALAGAALAAPPPAPDCDLDRPLERGEVAVYVLTASPGPRPYSFFGHSALWVRSQPRDLDHIWEYGVVDSGAQEPLTAVLMGTLLTGWSVTPLDKELRRYQREDRRLLAQRLDLSAVTRNRLQFELTHIQRTQKGLTDRFHWADNNCTTHLRDLLDPYLEGALGVALDGPAPLSHRHEVNRHLAPVPWAWFGLHFLGGAVMDHERTRWEAAFLPVRLYEALDAARVPGEDGSPRPVVSEVCTLHPGSHPFAAPAPPDRRAPLWGLGLGLAGLVGGLGVAGRRSPGARVASGALIAGWGLVLGVLGSVLAILWAASAWWGWRPNHNLLLASPLSLGMVGAGVAWARGRDPGWARALTTGLAALGALVLGLLAVPAWPQEGLDLFGLLWPATAAAALVGWLRHKRT